jgi:ubiquinone/menaquinone biosynthesis C-methylase UbiE
MARISYDDQTAAAYHTVREIPRDGLGAWREAVQRHVTPSPSMTIVDIGAGTGAFAAAVQDADPAARTEARTSWLDLLVLR